MEGNDVSSGGPLCRAWTPASSHFTARPLHPRPPRREGSNEMRIADTSPASGPFIVTMVTHYCSRVLDMLLRFLDTGRSRGLGEGPASLSTGERRGHGYQLLKTPVHYYFNCSYGHAQHMPAKSSLALRVQPPLPIRCHPFQEALLDPTS